MTGFSMNWLNLRESADQQARSSELLHSAVAFASVEGGVQPVVLDLGAGTGSTYRAFDNIDSSLEYSTTWRLVDNDKELLKEATRRAREDHRIETYELDLNRVEQLPLEGVRLITASALFDLVSGSFIDRLVGAVNLAAPNRPVAIYAALNYDGSTFWEPIHPLDHKMLDAFNTDQNKDKGFGSALGPGACDYFKQALEHAGFSVKLATSPWLLEGKDSQLVAELIQGIGNAVWSCPDIAAKDIAAWLKFRLAHAGVGLCNVGHTDLLATRE